MLKPDAMPVLPRQSQQMLRSKVAGPMFGQQGLGVVVATIPAVSIQYQLSADKEVCG